MAITAQQTTGSLGQRLVAGFDLSNVFVDNSGDRPIRVWEREVTYQGTATLDEVLSLDKYLKFDLLANILRGDEKLPLSTEVELYASGAIKEIRVGKKAYRCKGNKYYGTNKKPVIEKDESEDEE